MVTMKELYFSDVPEKLSCARRLNERHGPDLLTLPGMREKLHNLEVLSQALQRQMAGMAMFALCKACAEKVGGGCCSAYMANETDALLLLLNMLLGVEVASQRDDSFECCYLGPQGCTLRVKPIFCLNYNCHHILTGNTSAVVKNLEKAASAVLLDQTAVEKILLRHILSR
ncbi:MAG: hypothetical protein M0P70_00020 [Desulfobulbaceae bacterium]|nr:hypothetical protein [Desulfobulbaceae bacterium]